MKHLVRVAIAFGVWILTTFAGLDRDRPLYPAVLMVIAACNELFAITRRPRLMLGNWPPIRIHRRSQRRIRSCVDAELAAAMAAELGGELLTAFRHLERAHVLGQNSTVQHLRVHLRMLAWGLRHHDLREVAGQILRIIGAGSKTCVGLVPKGNTGGANVSAFKSMTIPNDLADLIARARFSAEIAPAWSGQ